MSGGNGDFRIAKLKNDMVSLAGPLTTYTDMEELRYFNGGPWMFERNGTYYLMYSGNSSGGDELHYAVSSSPAGPWTYQNLILDSVGTGDSSQGSIVQFNNRWYLFYHNARLSKGNGALRSVCVEELTFNADGSIRKAVQTGAAVERNGPVLNTTTLDTKFGAGNYEVQAKYDENESFRNVGIALIKTIGALDTSVIVGGGARKGTGDISTGAIHDLHLSGAYAEFTELPGGLGGKVLIRFNYALGSGTATIQLTVNGTAAGSITMTSSGGWGALAISSSVEVTLVAGDDNTIRISGQGVNIASLLIYGESE
jgi:hypothetical protein